VSFTPPAFATPVALSHGSRSELQKDVAVREQGRLCVLVDAVELKRVNVEVAVGTRTSTTGIIGETDAQRVLAILEVAADVDIVALASPVRRVNRVQAADLLAIDEQLERCVALVGILRQRNAKDVRPGSQRYIS
jgi:hypothetical protein